MTSRAIPSMPSPAVGFYPLLCRRPPLLLALLVLLFLLSLSINVFFGAKFLLDNGTSLWSVGQCAPFAHSNSYRPKRQIEQKENNGVLERMEYAVTDNMPNSAEKEGKGAEMPLFLPLYTQLSQRHLSKICHEKFTRQFQLMGKKNEESSAEDADENRTKQRKTTPSRKKGRRRKKTHEKVCPPIRSFGTPFLVAHRTHLRGAAMRRGDRWFLTEYDTGYALFEFDLTTNEKNESVHGKKRRHFGDEEEPNTVRKMHLDFPSQIHTLPEPFRGTDHSVGGTDGEETFFYQLASEDHRIQALHLRTGKRLSRLIYAAKFPLYGHSASPSGPSAGTFAADHSHMARGQSTIGWPSLLSSFSSMDLEVDQSALWVLFRRPNLSDSAGRPLPHLTVLKLRPESLKKLAQWDLEQTRAHQMVNAFVACGQLYGVEQTKEEQTAEKVKSMLQIVPLFDFQMNQTLPRTALPISAQEWTVPGLNSIANAQYDAVSDSLVVFGDGNVFISKIQRRKASAKQYVEK